MTLRSLFTAALVVAVAAMTALLSGCGGGGDDPPPQPETRWPAHCTQLSGACK